MNSDLDLNEKNIEDKAIIEAILNGDLSKFVILEKKYNKLITNLIRKMIKNEEDVADLAQESLIKAYKSLSSFNPQYSFSSWIYRIASNTCIDFLRKKRFPTISLDQPVGGEDSDVFFEIEDSSFIPDTAVLNGEKSKAITEAIETLPENYRAVIKLRHEEEKDYQEISDELGLPLGTVKAHLFRARKLLLEQLKKRVDLFGEYL